MTPQVSVVIPVFNGERFFAEALASLQSETEIPTEFIIVDDGCRDGSMAIAKGFADRDPRFRMVRAMKNRYGPVDEVGCFDLASDGISAVTDPTGLFVEHHTQDVSGTCVAVTMEGRRPLLAEVQALLTPSPLERPRRTVSGVESSRVDMVLAVLQRHARLRIAGSDVFVKVTCGS